ncbi:hypothetical protein YPPY66_4220 [Yersinia pestis PY-66]|uniref:Uncharacterized protein n=4 Tax=Yersinia pseudotuberculosis complex TaxID=1649845 RepID=A0A0H2W2L9_YERPE|nr:hypothetical protein YP_0267 [Yersinia pestis biovar Microtus str. 91001]ABP41299.1 conserved hypothetical protein [Yersinia pestis Pestoides F]ABS47993.1 hypothetical protein YpsIP31758_3361 [Yersinia pseudotuberculosis IP 31758]ABX86290.1 hypothetical protein YpAngola_A1032 [Yersinia pestis Angola]ADW00194.1 hypothetical protein YPC_3753 [Yersinia pestis biovar Medievalis str. Harbin 35]EDR33975.1 hypothetical protein YPIP275_4102 [Yersinia pestis biovar Orientalis str. IP275]EDR39479.1 
MPALLWLLLLLLVILLLLITNREKTLINRLCQAVTLVDKVVETLVTRCGFSVY